MMYGNMQNAHNIMDNIIHQLPNYNTDYGDNNNDYGQPHYHHKNSRLSHPEHMPGHDCSGSRKPLRQKYKPNYPATFLPGFPAEFPAQFPAQFPLPPIPGFAAQFPSPFPAPDVIVLPYPIPVMLMPQMPPGAPVVTTPSAAPVVTTQVSPTQETKPSTETPSSTTTSTPTTTPSTTETSTGTTSTVAPMPLEYDTTTRRVAKRFKIMTIKTYRRKGDNPPSEMSFNRKLPKYGIVRIPEKLALSLMQKLNNENKARRKKQHKRIEEESDREFRLRQLIFILLF